MKSFYPVLILTLTIITGQAIAGGSLRLKVEDINGNADTDIFKSESVTITATYVDAQAKKVDGEVDLDSGDQSVTGWKSWKDSDDPDDFSSSTSYSRSLSVNGQDHEKGDTVKVSFQARVSGDKQPSKKSKNIKIIVGNIKLSASTEFVEADPDTAPKVTLTAKLDKTPANDLKYIFYAEGRADPIHISQFMPDQSYTIELNKKDIRHIQNGEIYGNEADAERFWVVTSNVVDFEPPDGSGDGGGPLDDTHPPVATEADVIWATVKIVTPAGVEFDQNTKFVIGDLVSMKASVQPAVPNLNYEWSIPGETVKSYTQALDKAEKKDLSGNDLDDETVSFHWIDDGKKNVDLSVSIKGKTIEKEEAFDVESPSFNGLIGLGDLPNLPANAIFNLVEVTPVYAPNMGVITMSFGGFVVPATLIDPNADPNQQGLVPGIQFLGTASMPESSGGTFKFVQTVDTHRVRDIQGGGKKTKSSNGNYILDTLGNGVPYNGQTWPAEAGASISNISTSDSPGQPIFGNDLQLSVHDKFKMYAMFQSSKSGSIPVTLEKTEWFWSGSATKNANGFPMTARNWSRNPSWSQSTELPEWDKNVTDLLWQ